ncbi:hypothetical protein BDM02DRAFT_3186339 [Thelephora ganbajun]|uniref:Uncharacterized protein n=1 Tax=Thelephora ganbajun TaxID=370292 RepID=A0ACB6ZI76_THEGA|nr:hypothetical protein BDM02DRAFT_3186339 [Thelephora ganbajun]
MSHVARKTFMKNWFAIEAIPIYTIVGAVVGGAGWYLYRLARGSEVVWTRANPVPRNSVEQDQNIKMLAVGHKFDGGSWKRGSW